MNPFQQNGAFSWHELMTTDLEGAKAFYGQLLGWELNEGPIEGMPYTVISAGGAQIGGMMRRPPDAPAMPPTWGTYITVADVDATVKQAETLGGKVLMPPMDIETVGRCALLQDPQGATFYVIAYTVTDA